MRQVVTISFIACLLIFQSVSGQVVSFSHLNTSNGLSDNYIQSLAIDKSGFLWVGTSDGLNIYDGYTITSWYKSSNTGLPSDTIRQLFCDSKNQIWVTTPSGVAWSDEKTRFHSVVLPGNKEKFSCWSLFETAKYGVVLFTPDGHFYLNSKTKNWEKIDWLSKIVNDTGFNTGIFLNDDRAVFVYEEKAVVVDYKTERIIIESQMQNAVTACLYNNTAFALASRNGSVSIIDLNTQKELKSYHVYNETGGERSSPRVTEMVKAADGSLVIATVYTGLVIIDSTTNKIITYKHDPLNASSIAGNMTFRVFTGSNGDVIVGTQTGGVSICNTNNKRAIYKRVFSDNKGNIFDGHINEIAEDKKGVLWICANDRLIKWNRVTNATDFYKYFYNDAGLGPRNVEMRSLCIDKKGRIWVGTIGAGVVLFNEQSGTFRLITDTSLGVAVHNTYINDMIEDSEGNIWAGSYGGMYTIDPDTYHITTFEKHSLLKEMNEIPVISFYEDAQQRIWIGTQRRGIYCYDKVKNKLTNYTTSNGLLGNTCNALTGDKYGNIYTAHLNGFSIVGLDGSCRHFSRANGMRFYRCESIVPDNEGYVWVANNKSLARYSPTENKLESFEENTGISTDGFRFDAACRSVSGELFFGTHRGINYFDPLQIKKSNALLRVNNYQVSLPDSVIRFDNSPLIKVAYTRNSVQFYFTAINLTGSRNIAYEYMLEGFDKEWQKGVDIHFARYPSLPPGDYKFKVKASIDRVNWVNANNEVSINITPPLWQRWWFVSIAAILLVGIIVAVVQFRINRIRYKERLKTIYNKKISETEMKALRAQMNPHFIFNSLNSINKYILKSDHTTASKYLTRFAKLIRLILDNSNSKEVSLSNELEALKLYIEMESLRFTNKFSYEINVDDDISVDTLQVPPLIIQPYVENAIWHGLLHKEAGGKLIVSIKKTNDNMLQCIIEDNGVGRIKAQELKSKSATASKSLGMKLTEERLNMLNQYASLNASINIEDLKNEIDEPVGTRVTLTIPI